MTKFLYVLFPFFGGCDLILVVGSVFLNNYVYHNAPLYCYIVNLQCTIIVFITDLFLLQNNFQFLDHNNYVESKIFHN